MSRYCYIASSVQVDEIKVAVGDSVVAGDVLATAEPISLNLAFVGLVFGMYPANKASRMRPVDALRFA